MACNEGKAGVAGRRQGSRTRSLTAFGPTVKVDHARQLAVFVPNVDTIMRLRFSPVGDNILTANSLLGVQNFVS